MEDILPDFYECDNCEHSVKLMVDNHEIDGEIIEAHKTISCGRMGDAIVWTEIREDEFAPVFRCDLLHRCDKGGKYIDRKIGELDYHVNRR
jgi:hypothetical protein